MYFALTDKKYRYSNASRVFLSQRISIDI